MCSSLLQTMTMKENLAAVNHEPAVLFLMIKHPEKLLNICIFLQHFLLHNELFVLDQLTILIMVFVA